jgi:hypothetical protein
MATTHWEPGTTIRRSLDDGYTYYGRLLEFPWAVFYDHRGEAPEDDPSAVVDHAPLFTVAAHKDLLAEGEWEGIGVVPLDGSLRPPKEQFIQDDLDPDDCQIINDEGEMRPATREECEGLEAAAVWEPEHLAERLVDHYAGRPNEWVESLKLRK